MSYFEDNWFSKTKIEQIDEYLDGNVPPEYGASSFSLAQDWARIAKAQEEAGEAVAAFIGYTGQNPRKGFTHSMDEVLAELADLALTGIYAIQHFTKDSKKTDEILGERLSHHWDRLFKKADK